MISGSAIQCMSCADSVALKEEIAKLREEISILKKEKVNRNKSSCDQYIGFCDPFREEIFTRFTLIA